LCLSVAFSVGRAPRDVVALPLAAGVAVRRAIVDAAGIEIGLKWPTDLVWAGRKLGGILVEQAAGSADGARVVIGVGINVAVPTGMLPALSDWPAGAVDLAEATGGRPPTRIALAAATIAALAELAARFEREGFAAYRSEFASADALRDRAIHIVDDRATITGVARGVDALGALIVEGPDGSRRRIFSGDVSVRPVCAAAVTQ
jgi:BirA family biotin operon repressor/biotin-[acetyl-CoA-carboxylase] ligase